MNKFAITLVLLPAVARAEPSTPKDLLAEVKRQIAAQSEEDAARLQAFRKDEAKQKQLLTQAKRRLGELERRSKTLEKQFDQNERRILELEETLQQRQGTRGELFGVARQVAGDIQVELRNSMISAQHPGREKSLDGIAGSKDVPSLEQLQALWVAMQEEMTWSQSVARFETKYVDRDGIAQTADVVRIGPFTAAIEGAFLQWRPEDQILVELGRQPPSQFTTAISKVFGSTTEFLSVPVDPSKGSVLALLVQTPSFTERLKLGGVIGYIILGLGAAALMVGLVKLVLLLLAQAKIVRQLKGGPPQTSNPLGRILAGAQDLPGLTPEAFEARLEEGVLRESARLESALWLVKVVQIAAPLLGLLGTVTGMINTFQAITLFGTGDPRLMAGGISEALVTTMLGLMVAIPLVLLGQFLQQLARRLSDILEEQSAGLVAQRVMGSHHE